MDCEHLKLPGGGVAIMCGNFRKRCKFCGKRVCDILLCDWKVGDGKTCDAKMCHQCATEVGPDKHLCPPHQKLWAKHPKNPAGKSES